MKPELYRVRLSEAHSQETPCFNAKLMYDGVIYDVSNDGTGGANRYHPHLSGVQIKRLDQWAASTQPSIPFGETTLPMDFETWTFCKAFGDELCVS